MRRYESPAENWPRAFRIVQTCSSEYYFLFKYIRIPIFQIKLKILSLSPLIKDQRSSQQFVSYWRNFHSNLNERLILSNYTACWNIEKRKKERKKVIPKHFSKCSLLPLSPPWSTTFSASHGLFLPGGTVVRIARTALDTNPLPFITGGAAAIRRACVTENTRPPEIYFIPALALDGLASRHGTGRGSRPGNNGEREKRSGFSGNPEMILRNPLRHAYTLETSDPRSSSWNGPAIRTSFSISVSLCSRFIARACDVLWPVAVGR